MKVTPDRTKKLCDILKREARRKKIGPAEIARQMGTSTSQVCTIFACRTTNPGIFTIAAMLQVLGQDFEWLALHMGERL